MKKIKFIHVMSVVIAVLLLLNLRPEKPQVRSDFQLASFGARITVQLNAGDYVNCPTFFIPINPQNARCAPLQATRTPAPSATASATVSQTAVATDTPTATPDGGLQVWEVWHPTGAHLKPDGTMSENHNHGQEPDEWANQYSLNEFGYPIVFGGNNRSGEAEALHKHEAYTVTNFSFSPNGCLVDFVFIFHGSSTPLDRAAAVHSFEIYARDCSGNISFGEGVYWTGDPNNEFQRMCRFQDARRDQYAIEGRCVNDTAHAEQWYVHAVNWDFSLTFIDATTFFEFGEHLGDLSPNITGSNELTMRLEVTLLPNPNVSLPRKYQYPLDAWWCAQHIPTIGTRRFKGQTLPFPFWTITGAVDSPSDCPAGYLPQYIASTLPAIYTGMDGGNTIRRIQFDGADIVEFPN